LVFRIDRHYLDEGQFGFVPIEALFNYVRGYGGGSENSITYNRLPHETITFFRHGLRTDRQKPRAIPLIYSHYFARGYGTD